MTLLEAVASSLHDWALPVGSAGLAGLAIMAGRIALRQIDRVVGAVERVADAMPSLHAASEANREAAKLLSSTAARLDVAVTRLEVIAQKEKP